MAAKLDIRATRGGQLSRRFSVQVRSTGEFWDFSGRTAHMQVRDAPGGALVLDLSSINGKLIAGTPSTLLVLLVSPTDMSVPAGQYVHDLWIDGVPLLMGRFIVEPSVTEN